MGKWDKYKKNKDTKKEENNNNNKTSINWEITRYDKISIIPYFIRFLD